MGSHGSVGIAELFMKHVDNVHVDTWLVKNEALMESFEGSECVKRSWNYLADVNECETEKLVTLFESSLPKSQEKMLSIRKQIEKASKQEGRQEGWQEGIQEGLRKTARQMLVGEVPISKVQKWTGLSPKELKKLKEEVA